VLEISKGIVAETGHYNRVKKAAELALLSIDKGHKSGDLALGGKEQEWLKKLIDDIYSLPATLEELAGEVVPDCEKLDPAKYDLKF
jgi:hypothetical protein